MSNQNPAAKSGTFALGEDLLINRLGYGTMQLTGKGIWGEPRDPEEAVRVLQKAVNLGVNFIDTADSYGPNVANRLLKKALHPYNEDLVIATKVGLTRSGPDIWRPVGRPEYLRQQVEINLMDLGQERLDLLQLHRIDPKVPLAEQLGELEMMRQEGKIRHIGLSQVSIDEIKEAREIAPIVSVQNLYNLANRESEAVLEYCEQNNMAFIPWFPLATGGLAKVGSPLDKLAQEKGVQPAQLALAWLLKRSPVMLPIPGTSSVAHVEENIAAAAITLNDDEFNTLTNVVNT